MLSELLKYGRNAEQQKHHQRDDQYHNQSLFFSIEHHGKRLLEHRIPLDISVFLFLSLSLFRKTNTGRNTLLEYAAGNQPGKQREDQQQTYGKNADFSGQHPQICRLHHRAYNF